MVNLMNALKSSIFLVIRYLKKKTYKVLQFLTNISIFKETCSILFF